MPPIPDLRYPSIRPMTVVQVRPELLRWACQRSRRAAGELNAKFPYLEAWLRDDRQPTLKQLEAFAKFTHTPIGYLFLRAPPVEELPIPDLRTMKDRVIETPSPDLLDTVHLCQERQEWYRDFAEWMGEGPKDFVGSLSLESDIVSAATSIRSMLDLDLDERRALHTWTDALRKMVERADEAGVLVMVSGVVGSNSYRKLDPREFRGFALADPIAPLVFVNAADTKAAQMFTLAHELCHIWLGESALSNPAPSVDEGHRIETFCNAVAAELLVPIGALEREVSTEADLTKEMARLAHVFKVSTLVVLRRLRDANHISKEVYWNAYDAEVEKLREKSPKASGGDFYATLGVRVSKRFARAMVVSTLEGRSSFTDAFRMLGFNTMDAFDKLGHKLGVT